MKSHSVFIVVLNWNSANDTIRCITNLKKITYSNYELLVIDNGSNDDSVTQIIEAFPEIQLKELPNNLGFTGGCNEGMSEGLRRGFESILLLNNDAITAPDFLEKLVHSLNKEQKIGAVQPKILRLSDSTKIWNVGGKLDFLGTSESIRDEKLALKLVRNHKIDWLSGCCLLIKSEAIKSVGLFDDNFFAYHEDVDFSIRLRKKGFKLDINFDSIIYHDGGGSSTKQNQPKGFQVNPIIHYYNFRNKIFIYRKHFGHLIPILSLLSFFRFMLFYAYFVFRGNKEKQKAVWNGLLDGWLTKLK
jgi:GT2 family glycosyltransferase